MKRASLYFSVALVTCVLGLAVFGLFTRKRTDNLEPKLAEIKVATTPPLPFKHDPALAATVKTIRVQSSLVGKIGDVGPEHWMVVFADKAGNEIGWLRILPVKKFRDAVLVYTKQEGVGTDWSRDFDDQIQTMNRLVRDQPQGTKLTKALVSDRPEFYQGKLPFLPLWEGTQVFHGAFKYFEFRGGKGLGFLTETQDETSLITTENLEYVFQGITNDGQLYVSSKFRLSAPFLPSEFDPEVIAWAEKNYLLPKSSEKYQSYLRTVVPKLEALPADQFKPNLDLIQQLIRAINLDSETVYR